MIAGMIRFMIQIPAAVNPIPNSLVQYNNIIVVITFPRCTSSVIVMEGITAITRNETLTAQKACHHKTSTPNKRNSRKYCTIKTIKRNVDKDNNRNNSVASNSSKVLTR